jgi:hypothetical protein
LEEPRELLKRRSKQPYHKTVTANMATTITSLQTQTKTRISQEEYDIKMPAPPIQKPET